VLFLVDPGIRIVSTANVPPQQRDWWAGEVIRAFEGTGKGIEILSAEVREKIFEGVEGFPIGMMEAKETRLRLMEERKSYVHRQDSAFAYNGFNLCEH